jgi:hypothetical protein
VHVVQRHTDTSRQDAAVGGRCIRQVKVCPKRMLLAVPVLLTVLSFLWAHPPHLHVAAGVQCSQLVAVRGPRKACQHSSKQQLINLSVPVTLARGGIQGGGPPLNHQWWVPNQPARRLTSRQYRQWCEPAPAQFRQLPTAATITPSIPAVTYVCCVVLHRFKQGVADDKCSCRDHLYLCWSR